MGDDIILCLENMFVYPGFGFYGLNPLPLLGTALF